jgi:hypothetical protein
MPAQTRRTATKRTVESITSTFRQWLTVRDQTELGKERQEVLRQRQLAYIESNGEPDEKGNVWFNLPEPIEFEDRKGKVFKYTTLKRQRALRPAVPTPEPDLAIELLKKKKLWLTAKQEDIIKNLHIACPYATVYVDVDVDAVALLLFKGVITDDEYEALLPEQEEVFSFVPAES